MKTKIIYYFFFLYFSVIVAQDGGNIKYISPKNIDSTLIGKTCHIDFGRRLY